MNKIINLITILIICFLSINLFSYWYKTTAQNFFQPVVDPFDELSVISPAPNTILRNNVRISWLMSDNEQTQIPYTVTLNDNASCINQIAEIAPSSIGPSSPNPFSINWNTNSTQSSYNIQDGNYCLKICVTFKYNSENYLACNGRSIRLVNNNTLPQIISFPNKLMINETEQWSYQIIATDAQNDALEYRIILGAPFLSINSSSGLLYTNNNSRNLPDGVHSAQYRIIIGVSDNMSGEVTQQFNLIINKPIPQNPPQTNQNDSNSRIITPDQIHQNQTDKNESVPVTQETIENKPSKINILSNISQTVKENFDIVFEVYDPDGISSINIYLVEKDNQENKFLVRRLNEENIKSNLTIDIDDILDGLYYLLIEVTDKLGVSTSRSSSIFSIKRDSTETKIESDLLEKEKNETLIVNVIPQNGTNIYERRPAISGEFLPSTKESKINTESFIFKINGSNYLDSCLIDQFGFVCTPNNPLEIGEQKIYAEITDTEGKKGSLNLTFFIKKIEEVQSTISDKINVGFIEIPRNSIGIILLICCVTIVLLFIPWFIISKLFNKNKSKTEYQENIFDFVKPENNTNSSSTVSQQNLLNKNETETPEVTTEIIEDYLSYVSPDSNNISKNQIKSEILKDSYNSSNPTTQESLNLDEFVEPEQIDKK